MFTKWEEYEDDEEGMATDREFAQIVSELVGSVCRRMEETASLSEVEKQYVASVLMKFAISTNWMTFSAFLVSAYQTSHRFIYAYFLARGACPPGKFKDTRFNTSKWQSRMALIYFLLLRSISSLHSLVYYNSTHLLT